MKNDATTLAVPVQGWVLPVIELFGAVLLLAGGLALSAVAGSWLWASLLGGLAVMLVAMALVPSGRVGV
jgi:hypothetical protein